jgi:hypothetical protein
MIDIYNLLVRTAKGVYKLQLFIQKIDELREESDGNVAARKVARLAQELKTIVSSLQAHN